MNRRHYGKAMLATLVSGGALSSGALRAQSFIKTRDDFQIVAGGRLDIYKSFGSKYVDARTITVFVPQAPIDDTTKRSVLYMHDGQNLFDGTRAYGGKTWRVIEALNDKALALGTPLPIVVGIDNNGAKRHAEYMPQKIFDGLPQQAQQAVLTRSGHGLMSDAYLKFIVEELKPFIDTKYETLTGRDHTRIMGSSMGGLISFYAACEYPDVFSACGCLSMHLPLVLSPDGLPEVNTYSQWVADAFDSYLTQVRPDPAQSRFYVDHGTIELDGLYRPFSVKFERVMAKHGFDMAASFLFKVLEGEPHNEISWAKRLGPILDYLYTGKA